MYSWSELGGQLVCLQFDLPNNLGATCRRLGRLFCILGHTSWSHSRVLLVGSRADIFKWYSWTNGWQHFAPYLNLSSKFFRLFSSWQLDLVYLEKKIACKKRERISEKGQREMDLVQRVGSLWLEQTFPPLGTHPLHILRWVRHCGRHRNWHLKAKKCIFAICHFLPLSQCQQKSPFCSLQQTRQDREGAPGWKYEPNLGKSFQPSILSRNQSRQSFFLDHCQQLQCFQSMWSFLPSVFTADYLVFSVFWLNLKPLVSSPCMLSWVIGSRRILRPRFLLAAFVCHFLPF